jgi:hypothetical protein
MPLSKTINGTATSIPVTRETGWGNNVTNLLALVCDLFSAATTILHLKVARISGAFVGVSIGAPTSQLDLSLGYNFAVTLGASTTFSFINPVNATRYFFYLKQDGTGGRTITWPAAVKWRGGSAPVLSTAANARDVVCLMYHQADGVYLGEYGTNFA